MNLKGFLSHLFFRLRWIQIELTSFCNGKCIYCPHRVYSSLWKNRHFSYDLFLKLLESFKPAKLLYLQGWGEPFLHPKFFDFVQKAKKENFLIGTTTNGCFLDEDKIKRIIEEGIDLIAFSLAGIEKNNDVLREGTSFKKVIWGIETLQKYKISYNSAKPIINIAYMWLSSAKKDLVLLPKYLKDLGVRQIVVNTLTFVPTKSLQSEVIYFNEDNEKIAKEAISQAKELGMDMRVYLPVKNESLTYCPENIHLSLFINSSANVSPCVFLSLPVTKESLFYYFENQKYSYKTKTFGNLEKESLKDIWNKKEYKSFRKNFKSWKMCNTCYKPFLKEVTLEEAESFLEVALVPK